MNKTIGLIFLASVCLPACGDDDGGDQAEDGVEIEGTWVSNFESTEVIEGDSWSVDSSFGTSVSEIVEFSNDDNSAVLGAEDGTFGRVVWTEITDGSFYYCNVSYLEASVEDAIANSQPTDTSDPLNSGCGAGDFGWTMLTRQ